MDQEKKGKRRNNPRENAGILSIITFFFTYDILRKGIKRDLEEDDIYEIIKDYKAEQLGDLLEDEWEKERQNKSPSILRVIFRLFGKRYLAYGLMQVIMKTILILISPISMGKLVSYFTPESTMSKADAWFYACITIGVNFIYFVYSHNYMLLINQLGLEVRAGFCSLLYRKALRLSATSLGKVTTGKIITLITKDVLTFDTAIMFGNDLWIGVVQTSIIGYMMYRQIGISAVVGLVVFIAMIPIQLYLGKRITIYRIKSSAKTDDRLRVTQESFTAIRIIKMYAWEKFFSKVVAIYRKYEMRTLRKIYYLKALSLSLGTLSSKISFYVCVMVYISLGNAITAEKAFVVLGYYHTLRSTLTIYIPLGISQLAELRSSLVRIKQVIMEEETTSDYSALQVINKSRRDFRVLVNKATVIVDNKMILDSITIEAENGLIAITGSVGSGKSALLGLLLKDLTPTKGTVEIQGSISYASQEPWLFPGSIKQNILFGQPYNKERYRKVLNVCCLRADLDLLPNGDLTIASDRGLNLSRGQQARINLARAVYKDCNIYLLDDCLSALDAHVSQQVFDECIKGLLKDKLCIIVTHHIRHLQQADKIIILDEGFIEKTGSFKDLEQKGTQFKNISVNESIDTPEKLKSTNKADVKGAINTAYFENNGIHHRDVKVNRLTETSNQFNTQAASEDKEDGETKTLLEPKLAEKAYSEEKEHGKVRFSIYKSYFNFGGGIPVILALLVIFLIAQGSMSYTDVLIGKWVDAESNLSDFKTKNLTGTPDYQIVLARHAWTLNLYTTMTIMASLFTLGRAFFYFIFSTVASIRLHKATFEKIMGATMQFFDTHRLGNILNRFSRDLAVVDENIPYIIFDAFRIFLIILGILYVICNATAWFLIPTCVLLVILYFVRRYYLPSSISLKRLEGVTRSPVIGHLKASLEGLQTIRANKAQGILQHEFDKHLNVFHSVYYMYMTTSRFFGFFMDFLCMMYTTTITMTFLLVDTGAMAGKVGLALSQALSLTGMLQWGIRQWAELENHMTNVERILEYTTMEQEISTGCRPSNWPNEGRVEYSNVTLKYRADNAPVLKNISFVIEPLQKVGIVGRTGAGKSSIIATLFRLYEVEGSITIDDKNIKDIALETLRSQISIIPQDPVLFSGSIRDNLDPFKQYSDTDLWKVLEDVSLKDVVESLDLKITEGGNNFSTGQRQLICLARTIINKNKILVLDEATANVDPQTDVLIQRAIKDKFSQCTVLTIAHRLDTVLNSDKVMVIDKGTVVEFDSPKALLENDKSVFCGMIKTAGILTNNT